MCSCQQQMIPTWYFPSLFYSCSILTMGGSCSRKHVHITPIWVWTVRHQDTDYSCQYTLTHLPKENVHGIVIKNIFLTLCTPEQDCNIWQWTRTSPCLELGEREEGVAMVDTRQTSMRKPPEKTRSYFCFIFLTSEMYMSIHLHAHGFLKNFRLFYSFL